MRIVARSTLKKFVKALARRPSRRRWTQRSKAWFREVRKARWQNMADVKRSYATASIVGAEPHRVQHQGQ